ncbi:MAG: hypothetical protein QOI16_3637, partial [Pseudonocardiales bacterium]|nr:hypothetical protein [Pseudonocardiales bacterium]
MTTLGSLSVGLLVLVLVAAVGIALLARRRRRSPRGPEQPRTVADLVKMREAAVQAEAGGASATASASTAESEASAVAMPSAESGAAEQPTEMVAPESAAPEGVPGAEAPEESPSEAAGDREAEAELVPDPASPMTTPASLQDTPWARAARMADPEGEWTASARAARERQATFGPRPVPPVGPKTAAADKAPTPPSRPRLSLLHSDRPDPGHDTTTIAHLPQALARAAAEPQQPAPDTPVLSDDVTGPIVLPTLAQAPGQPADDETVEIGRGLADSPTVDLPQGFRAEQAEPTRQTPADEPTTRLDPLGSAPSEPAHPEVGTLEVDDAEGGGSAPQDRVTTFEDAPVEPVVALVGAAVVGNGLAAVPTNGHAAAPTNGHAAGSTNGTAPVPTPARVAGRVRRSPADTAAEQAAADLALLRTFGVAGPGHTAAADDTEIELEGCGTDDAEPSAGAAQPVSFRVVGRDGRGLAGASVTLLDDHGREIAGTVADDQGAGALTARRPGGYMLVTAAAGYQPGAVAIAVSDAAVDTEIPLTRSASIAGSVGGEDGPIVGAQLVLVQDGEIVETAESGADGAYRFADLAAGEYGLSVSA